MKVAVYSSHDFEKKYLIDANKGKHILEFITSSLDKTTVQFAKDSQAVAAFVSDNLNSENLTTLHQLGVKYITLRSAGYNNLDLATANKLGLLSARVPAYSPYSVAEHAVGLMIALNRKIVRANAATHQLNFSLDGLVGFDLNGKTVGIIGTGKIGSIVIKILHGFGCKIIAHDTIENKELILKYNVVYSDLKTLCENSDIISLHVPLNSETTSLINGQRIKQMKQGVMIINTSRGNLIETVEIVKALKQEKIGYFGMDVYEDEKLFFKDHSNEILKDDLLARLMTFNNVIITGHQAFLTQEALKNIAETTIYNLDCFEKNTTCENLLI